MLVKATASKFAIGTLQMIFRHQVDPLQLVPPAAVVVTWIFWWWWRWAFNSCADGAAGGGSGYIGSSLLTDGETTTGGGAAAGTSGSFEITATDTSVSSPITLTISGETTNVLTVSANAAVSATAKVVVSNSNAFNSPLTSETRTFTATSARPLIKIEQINNTNTATLSEHDLDDGEITFTDDAYPANQICIYSPERDIEIEMDLFGGKGDDNGANIGGEGGKSTIKFTLDQNVEYIITGLYDEINAPFIYRKASLIAVAGGGTWNCRNGGDGGGVNIGTIWVRGKEEVILSGELPANGIISAHSVAYAEDQICKSKWSERLNVRRNLLERPRN